MGVMSTSVLHLPGYSTSRASADGCSGVDAFGIGLVAGRVHATLQAWVERRARSRAAPSLDDRTLADIGLSRVQIEYWRP